MVVVDAHILDLAAGNLHDRTLPAGPLETDENGLTPRHKLCRWFTTPEVQVPVGMSGGTTSHGELVLGVEFTSDQSM